MISQLSVLVMFSMIVLVPLIRNEVFLNIFLCLIIPPHQSSAVFFNLPVSFLTRWFCSLDRLSYVRVLSSCPIKCICFPIRKKNIHQVTLKKNHGLAMSRPVHSMYFIKCKYSCISVYCCDCVFWASLFFFCLYPVLRAVLITSCTVSSLLMLMKAWV